MKNKPTKVIHLTLQQFSYLQHHHPEDYEVLVHCTTEDEVPAETEHVMMDSKLYAAIMENHFPARGTYLNKFIKNQSNMLMSAGLGEAMDRRTLIVVWSTDGEYALSARPTEHNRRMVAPKIRAVEKWWRYEQALQAAHH